ncbi:molybdate ABC transporter substrate-binding protein [Croceibacterium sp. LX-88]|uniref:Molybdate ABC transporter substrate-binding protein n=1 Tax=Croceibacterium selenioxidans TaxID=2838833 RepID=A0ABS5W7X0_9SPHN|nr:molybdate ABC transporter substrate-binding protein [Croceibacterium selenioxidans]MBT2135749.1 molybdate ABC transporter substrate-binding protein [Croceibacterium selenioxidans]
MTKTFSATLRWICLALLLPLIAACGSPTGPAKGPTVLAAASLQESLEEAAKAWAAQGHPAPVLSFAGSSALARQVEQGAPADVFISADQEWMDYLAGKNLIQPTTRIDLLTNRIVLIAPKGAAVRGLDALGEGKLALADPEAVPAGRYAKASLESLGEWQGVENKVVPAENVRAALALVERGEAQLGIVYATDAKASDKVEVVREFPASSHPPIRYPAALLAGSDNPEGKAFLEFLSSAEANKIFASHGFGIAE